jgi:hypothetical protein
MADIAITAANFLPSIDATGITVKAGVAITAGQGCYLDTATGLYKLALANGAGDIKVFAGFCSETVGANQEFILITKDPALALGGTILSGDNLWLSGANPGGVTKTFADLVTGWQNWHLGGGLGGNIVNFAVTKGGILP